MAAHWACLQGLPPRGRALKARIRHALARPAAPLHGAPFQDCSCWRRQTLPGMGHARTAGGAPAAPAPAHEQDGGEGACGIAAGVPAGSPPERNAQDYLAMPVRQPSQSLEAKFLKADGPSLKLWSITPSPP